MSFRMAVHAVVALNVACVAFGTGVQASSEYVAYATTKKGEFPLPESLDKIDATELINVRWGEYAGPQSRVAVLEVDNNSSVSSFRVSGPDGQVYSYEAGGRHHL